MQENQFLTLCCDICRMISFETIDVCNKRTHRDQLGIQNLIHLLEKYVGLHAYYFFVCVCVRAGARAHVRECGDEIFA
jgi:hypothetical protein